MGSRFRGNDTIGILGHRQKPRGYWAYRHAMPRARLDMPNGVLIRNVIASEARRSRFSTGTEKRDCFVAKFIPKQSVGLLAMTIKFRCRQFRKSRAQWYYAEWCDNSRYIRRMGPRPVASLGLPRALRFLWQHLPLCHSALPGLRFYAGNARRSLCFFIWRKLWNSPLS